MWAVGQSECFLEVSLWSSVTTHQLPGINQSNTMTACWCIADTEGRRFQRDVRWSVWAPSENFQRKTQREGLS